MHSGPATWKYRLNLLRNRRGRKATYVHPLGYVFTKFVSQLLNCNGILESPSMTSDGVISESRFCTRRAISRNIGAVPLKSGMRPY